MFDAIEGLRRELTTLVNERDRRYTERSSQQDKAVVDALAAAEKAVNAALVAADKAVEKEQLNAEKWRDNANEWRQAMGDREARFLAKDEAALMVKALTDRVDVLATAASRSAGRNEGATEDRNDRRVATGEMTAVAHLDAARRQVLIASIAAALSAVVAVVAVVALIIHG